MRRSTKGRPTGPLHRPQDSKVLAEGVGKRPQRTFLNSYQVKKGADCLYVVCVYVWIVCV